MQFTGLFPETMREQVLVLLGLELGGIISQRLLRARSGGRAGTSDVKGKVKSKTNE